VSVPYQARAAEHGARRDAELRRSLQISRARLLVFLIAAGCVIWTFARRGGPPWLTVDAVLVIVFGVLVAWHARVDERATWHAALQTVSRRSAARVERRWDDLPPAEPPASVDLLHHAYAVDLDLFGRASLFQWLGPSATASGSGTLAGWLLGAADRDVVGARQAAVDELAPLDDWREQLAAHGELARDARQSEIDAFLAWAEGPAWSASFAFTPGVHGTIFPGAVYLLILALTASIWILLGLFLLDVTDAALWLIPMVIGVVVSFAYAGGIHRAFNRAGAGQRALSRYAALFEHATTASFSSPLLRALHDRLSAEGKSAPECMRSLNRILGCAELRSGAGIFHFIVQAVTLWDFHVLFALERWRQGAGIHVRDWLNTLAEMDALSSFAMARRDNPAWAMPGFNSDRVLEARALGHPLIADDRRICNDVQVGPPGTLLLVTGSNMSGKSTLLRAIGLNTVLAQAGSCVCAERLALPPCDLQSSIRVQDSLELGLSYFMAALARLKGVVDAAEHPRREDRVLLYLLDEILQGTNSVERGIAVRAVARHLLDAGAIGVMTTHDLSLANEEPLRSSAVLVHFTETVDDRGHMGFDYRLREGLATSRNALRLMQIIGIDLKEP
jgi:MutS domain V